MLGLSRYQWLVLAASWLGWGFDVFDALLFNYVSPICVPDLLGISPNDPGAKATITFWTGSLTSALLIGWAVGGIAFGRITDRIGRARTLLVTMLTYALATAACAFAPNLYVLGALRFVASLGIGGEWAAGASLVAEALPKEKRVLGGALLYTSAPAGLFLATFVNDLFTRKLDSIASDPSLSWRLVFLTGLVPAAVALLIRMKIKESETWSEERTEATMAALFTPALRRRTLGGLAAAVIALVTWWSCSVFVPIVASFLAEELPKSEGIELAALRTRLITFGTTAFNLGGLVGTLLTVPVALHLGRRAMFTIYFLLSSVAVWVTFGLDLAPYVRLYSMFFLGVTVFGVFGSFTFYLPELFPTHLRGTGSGFCYNTGRFITAAFPLLIGTIARAGTTPMDAIRWVAAVPIVGVLLVALGVVQETKHASDLATSSALAGH